MDMVENKMYCSNTSKWVAKIKQIASKKADEREAIAKDNLEFVLDNYSDEALDLI